jgi:hypothetical protein
MTARSTRRAGRSPVSRSSARSLPSGCWEFREATTGAACPVIASISEAIQSLVRGSGLLPSSLFAPRNDVSRAPEAPELCIISVPSDLRGRRECRATASPMAPCSEKSTGKEPQVQPDHPGIPCAMVLTLIARSPREPGFLAPVIARLVTARLGLSVGRPGPHAFTSASGSVVRARIAR